MDYKAMKKEELVAFCQENESLVEAGKMLVHLPKAIEAKDKEINKLKTQLEEAIEDKEKEFQEKYNKELYEHKNITDAEIKKLKDSLAESQKNYYDLDALRIKQLEEVLYAYGDFLKLTQAAVDSHMKLNEYIVNGLQGGKK